MYLVLLLAAGAIIGGVVVVAMGRGGEIAAFGRDRPVAFIPIRTPADVVGLRLPIGLFGYQVHATADALTALANLLAERDYEIDTLRSELWRLGVGRDDTADRVEAPGDAGSADDTADETSEPGAEADLASTEQKWRQ